MTISFQTGIGAWQNGAQQRWIRTPGALLKVEIPYSGLLQAQKNTVKSAVTSAKGGFDQTQSLGLPFLGSLVSFTNLGIDDDQWSATESGTLIYSGPLKLTQSITQNLSPGTAGQPFPVLANGTIGLLPYVQKKRFQTVSQRAACGPNYTYAEFAGGLSGYPTDGLMAWEFRAEKLNDADLATLTAHFIANWGRAFGFSFTDEDSTVYTKTHWASDDLAITLNGLNESSVTIALEAVN